MINKLFIKIVDSKWKWLVKSIDGDLSLHITEPRRIEASDDPWREFSEEWVSDKEWTYIEGFDEIFDIVEPGKYEIK